MVKTPTEIKTLTENSTYKKEKNTHARRTTTIKFLKTQYLTNAPEPVLFGGECRSVNPEPGELKPRGIEQEGAHNPPVVGLLRQQSSALGPTQ